MRIDPFAARIPFDQGLFMNSQRSRSEKIYKADQIVCINLKLIGQPDP